jgi:hypothetical protein
VLGYGRLIRSSILTIRHARPARWPSFGRSRPHFPGLHCLLAVTHPVGGNTSPVGNLCIPVSNGHAFGWDVRGNLDGGLKIGQSLFVTLNGGSTTDSIDRNICDVELAANSLFPRFCACMFRRCRFPDSHVSIITGSGQHHSIGRKSQVVDAGIPA